MKRNSAHDWLFKNYERGALAVILIAALALRLWGIRFGLPYRYHIDEAYSVLGALKTASGDLTPRYPVNSPNLWEFILLLEYGAMFVVGKLGRAYASMGDFAASYRLDPTWFYLLARGTSALLGTATVAAAYKVAREVYQSRPAGLLAALFLGVAFLHGRDSHYAVADAFVVFLTTVGVYLWTRYAQRGGLPSLLLGSLLVGIAVGLKYRPGGLTAGLMAAVLLHQRALRESSGVGLNALWRLSAAGIGLAVGYLVGFPGLLISVDLFKWHLNQAFLQAGGGFEGWALHPLSAWLFYLRSLEWGLGLPLLIMALGGAVLALRRRRAGELTVLASAVGFYATISILTTYFSRYALSLHPLLTVLAGGFASAVLGFARKRWATSAQLGVTVLILAMSLIPALRLARHDHLLTRTDTRTLAKRWVEANIPDGARIAVDWPVHGPPLSVPGDPEPASSRAYDRLVVGGKGLSDHPIEWYRNAGFDYLIASSFIYNIPLLDEEQDSERQAFYASLDRELEPIQVFGAHRSDAERPFVFDEVYGPVVGLWQRERPGPAIKVYQVAPMNGYIISEEEQS